MKQTKLKRLNIELTSRCNYDCVGCPTSRLKRGKGDIDTHLFFKIFEESGNRIEKVFLWNYGEPLLHPRIDEMLDGIKKYKSQKILSTNGSKLEDLSNLSFLNNLDEFIVSINGLTPEIYNLHQKKGDFYKVQAGIARVASYLKDAKTRFVMQIVAHKGNIGQIDEAVDFAGNNGFDELVVKSFNVMDSAQETFDKFVPTGTIYSRYTNSTSINRPTKSGKGRGCLDSMVINWDGSVNPCCWDYKGDLILGNVRYQGVYGVWNSEKAKEFRNQILLKNFPEFCVDCAVKPELMRIKISDKT